MFILYIQIKIQPIKTIKSFDYLKCLLKVIIVQKKVMPICRICLKSKVRNSIRDSEKKKLKYFGLNIKVLKKNLALLHLSPSYL